MAEAFTAGYEPVLDALKPCVVRRRNAYLIPDDGLQQQEADELEL